VDIVAYGCTSGSIVCPLPQVLKQMSDATGTPAVAAAGSVVAALRAFAP
jgi:arylmalonate decarboxylase